MEERDRKMFKLSSEETVLPSAFKEDQSFFQNCDTKLEVKEERIVYEIKEEGDHVNSENILLDTIKEEPVEIIETINREVKQITEENAKIVQEKRNKRRIKKLTSRKKLGRGQYEKFMEPALLTTELSGSLVKLPAHCNILAERMNSFQKRNFIPITGERPKKLKMKLKLKNVEKRNVKLIKKGSRVF